MGIHHVKNKDLREEIIKSKALDTLSPLALDMFILMVDKFSNKLRIFIQKIEKIANLLL